MEVTIDQFVLDRVFSTIETDDGPVFYASTVERDGWLVLYPNGEHLHTYRHPLTWVMGQIEAGVDKPGGV